jgi:hypothetical protein
MNSVAECNEFGVRYATIEILDWGDNYVYWWR